MIERLLLPLLLLASITAHGQLPCENGMAGEFPCENIDLMAFMALAELGGGEANDIWGWVDPTDSTEYVIMGRTNGTAFVNISDPLNPFLV
ncbi:MAG: regulator, partial [Bacteroidota bacterium]|nr:regulator [Bacteroidota bacterium]